MKRIKLSPDRILTTLDFPVYNSHILKIYFRICQKGCAKILPPTPVIHISKGLPLSNKKSKAAKEYNKRIKQYFKENPKIDYIMVDGSHKTTALVLARKPIRVAVFETDKDIKKFRSKIDTGEILGLCTEDTIKEILKEKSEHYFEAEFFETVRDKTDRMVKEKVIPQYMIDFYKRK